MASEGIRARWPTLAMHLCFVAAGIIGPLTPTRAVQVYVPGWMTYVWGGFLVVGGLACLIGILSRRWWGELVGLPLLSSASALYAVAVVSQYGSYHDGAFLFVGALILAQALGLFGQWRAALRTFAFLQTQGGPPPGGGP